VLEQNWASRQRLEHLAQRCGVEEPRWLYQIHYYYLTVVKRSPLMSRLILFDEELSSLLDHALELKIQREGAKPSDITVIDIEDFLFAIGKSKQISMCQDIRTSGLRMKSLARKTNIDKHDQPRRKS
jgi:hypothetical protein